jgi:uncharacterized membrane protein
MTGYQWLLAVHILCVVVWVGGTGTMQILAIRAQGASDPSRMVVLGGEVEWVGQHVYLPASILVLISGIAMVINGEWGWGHFWILFGLFGILFSAITGATFLGPEAGRLKKLMQEQGENAPEVRSRLSRIFLVSRIELLVLLLVVADMALKPGS